MNSETKLVLEGYPRCANTFLTNCFMKLLGEDYPIAHHCHAAPNVLEGVRLGKPTIVVYREPDAAVASLLIRNPEIFTPKLAYREYIQFYSDVLTVADRVLLVSFDRAVSDFAEIVADLNRHFAGLEGFEPIGIPVWGPQQIAETKAFSDRRALRIKGRTLDYSTSLGDESLRRRERHKSRVLKTLTTTSALAKIRKKSETVFRRVQHQADAH